jgi:predicted enzyme related to lactoylglutathione lyase
MKTDPKHVPAGSAAAKKGRLLNRRQMLAASAAIAAAGGATRTDAQAAAADPDIGTVWWNELLTKDPARARAFYSRVIGWTPKVVALDDPSRPARRGETEYTMFSAGSKEAAGAMQADDDTDFADMPASWLTYIQVADVDAASRRALEAGGKVLHAPADAPGVGRVAIIEDLEGARIGLVTPSGR